MRRARVFAVGSAGVIALAVTVGTTALADDRATAASGVAVQAPAPSQAAMPVPSQAAAAGASASRENGAVPTVKPAAPTSASKAIVRESSANAASAKAPAGESEAPLSLRSATSDASNAPEASESKSAPLTLAPEAATMPWYAKLLLAAMVGGAGWLAWQRRQWLGERMRNFNRTSCVRVLGRTSMGMRAEVALIEVGGMRLVVGVTPATIQTLAVLPEDATLEADSDFAPVRDDQEEPAVDLHERRLGERRTPADHDREPGERNPSQNNMRSALIQKIDFASRARSLFGNVEKAVGKSSSNPRSAAFAASRYGRETGEAAAPSPTDAVAVPVPVRDTLRDAIREPSNDAEPIPGRAPGASSSARGRSRTEKAAHASGNERDDDRKRRQTPRDATRDLPLEGQARGLALALRNKR